MGKTAMPIPDGIWQQIRRAYEVSEPKPAAQFIAASLLEKCPDYFELPPYRSGYADFSFFHMIDLVIVITLAVSEAKASNETSEIFSVRLKRVLIAERRHKPDLKLVT
jgi:hypothetical protein